MRIDILQSSAGKVISDFIMMVLLVWTVLSFFHNNISNGRVLTWGIQYNDCVSKAVLMSLVYCIGRICFTIHFQWSRIIFYVIIGLIALRELLFCMMQFLHGNGTITGSMGNTGLLGGFISVCLCFFGAGIVKDGKYFRLLFLLPLLVLEIISFSRAAWLSCAIVAGVLLFRSESLNRWNYKWKIPLFLSAFYLVIIVYYLKKESADSRLFMALLTLRNCTKVGLLGTGPGNYCGFYGRSLFDYYWGTESGLADDSIARVEALTLEKIGTGIPDCAYNELLRVFVETGFVGFALFAAVIVLSFLRLYRINDTLSYGFLALIVFSQFSFPSKMPLFCFLCALLMAAGSSTPGIKGEDRIGLYHVAWSLLCFVSFICLSKHRNADVIYNKLNNMQDSFEVGSYDEAAITGATIYNEGYASPKFLLTYGQALGYCHDYENSDKVINHALEISASPVFWKALGDISFKKEDYPLAEKQYLHSFVMMPNRLQPLLDLARLYHTTGDTLNLSRIGACAQRIIPKVENSKTGKIREEIMSLQGVAK